jgi:hypothetical protein
MSGEFTVYDKEIPISAKKNKNGNNKEMLATHTSTPRERPILPKSNIMSKFNLVYITPGYILKVYFDNLMLH